MPDYNAMKIELPKLRAALTRAKKKGPEAVMTEVKRAFARFDIIGYPDSWADWQRAADDAHWSNLRGGSIAGIGPGGLLS